MKVVEVLAHGPEVPSTCRQSERLPAAASMAPVASIIADRETPKAVPTGGRTLRAFCRPVTSAMVMMVMPQARIRSPIRRQPHVAHAQRKSAGGHGPSLAELSDSQTVVLNGVNGSGVRISGRDQLDVQHSRCSTWAVFPPRHWKYPTPRKWATR